MVCVIELDGEVKTIAILRDWGKDLGTRLWSESNVGFGRGSGWERRDRSLGKGCRIPPGVEVKCLGECCW